MLDAVDPLLYRVEAMPEQGCYNVTVLVDGTHERSIVMRVSADDVEVPEANMVPGWSRQSATFIAVVAAITAFDTARTTVGGSGTLLRDVSGGWDVGVGNVVLSPDGQPACVAHGPMMESPAATFTCETCGAAALFGTA